MVADFSMCEGTDFNIIVIVTGYKNTLPVAVDAATIDFVVWDAVGSPAAQVLLKTTEDFDITENPLSDDATLCAINIPIIPADAASLPVGTYRYEVGVTIATVRQVVYPLDGETATFDVIESLTSGVEDMETRHTASGTAEKPVVNKPVILSSAMKKKFWPGGME